MFLLEKQYELLGGVNFKYIYNLAKTTDWKSEAQHPDTAKQLSILAEASKRVSDMLWLIKMIADDNHPPLVVYAKDYLPL
jgi:hypothetical protein